MPTHKQPPLDRRGTAGTQDAEAAAPFDSRPAPVQTNSRPELRVDQISDSAHTNETGGTDDLEARQHVAQTRLQELLDKRCGPGTYARVTRGYDRHYTLDFEKLVYWEEYDFSEETKADPKLRRGAPSFGLSRNGSRASGGSTLRNSMGDLKTAQQRPLELKPKDFELIFEGFPGLQLIYTYGCKVADPTLRSFKKYYARARMDKVASTSRSNTNITAAGNERDRIAAFLCHQLPRNIVDQIQHQRCEVGSAEDYERSSFMRSHVNNSVMLLQGSATHLAKAMDTPTSQVSGHVWRKARFVDKVALFLAKKIESEEMKLVDFANALYALVLLHRESKYAPTEYVLAQRSFWGVDSGHVLRELHTQLWSGYTMKERLPYDYILVDIGSGQVKYFFVQGANNSQSAEVSREFHCCDSVAITTAFTAACQARQLSQNFMANATDAFRDKVNVTDRTFNEYADYIDYLYDVLMDADIFTDEDSPCGQAYSQLPIRYIGTKIMRDIENKYKPEMPVVLADLVKQIQHHESKLEFRILKSHEEADYESVAAKHGWEGASEEHALYGNAEFRQKDEKTKNTILASAFPTLETANEVPRKRGEEIKQSVTMMDAMDLPDSGGVCERSQLDLIGNLAWGKTSTQGQTRDGRYPFEEEFSFDLAIEAVLEFIEQKKRQSGGDDLDAYIEEDKIKFRKVDVNKTLDCISTFQDNFSSLFEATDYSPNHESDNFTDTLVGYVLNKLGKHIKLDQCWSEFNDQHDNGITDDGLEDLVWWCPDMTVAPDFQHCHKLTARAKDGLKSRVEANKVYFDYEGRITLDTTSRANSEGQIRISDTEQHELELTDKVTLILGVLHYRRDEKAFAKSMMKFREKRGEAIAAFPAMVGRKGLIEWCIVKHVAKIDVGGAAVQRSKQHGRRRLSNSIHRSASQMARGESGDVEGWLECVLKGNFLDVVGDDFFPDLMDESLVLPKSTVAHVLVETGNLDVDQAPELGRFVMHRDFEMMVHDRAQPASFTSQKDKAKFLSDQTQFEKGWRQTFDETWCSCSKGGFLMILGITAVGVLFWSMYEAAGLLSCNHLRGSCNFHWNRGSDAVRLYPTRHTWDGAHAACVQYGGALISIVNVSKNAVASRQLTNSFKGSCEDAWIGASDKDEEGVWLWKGQNSPNRVTFNGSVNVRDAPWMPQQDLVNNSISVHVTHWEPNGLSSSDEPAEERDCGVVGKAGNWSARSCEEMRCFFCTVPAGAGAEDKGWAFALGTHDVQMSSWRLLLISFVCLTYLCWIADVLQKHMDLKARIMAAQDITQLDELEGEHDLASMPVSLRIVLARSKMNTEIKRISSVRIGIPFPVGKESLAISNSALIPYLLEGKHRRAFESQALKAVVWWKWEHYAFSIHLTEFFLYCVFLAELTSLAIWAGSKDASTHSLGAHFVFVWLLNLRSFLQSIHAGWFGNKGLLMLLQWWEGLSFILEMLVNILPWLYFSQPDEDPGDAYDTTLKCFIAVAVVLAWFKLLSFLRPFRWSGGLVAMISQVMVDIVPFMFMFFVIIFGFTTCFFVLLPRNIVDVKHFDPAHGLAEIPEEEFETFHMTFFSVMQMLFGGWDPEHLEQAKSPVMAFTMFTIYMLVTAIILVNLMIAIMQDSYTKVHEASLEQLQKQKASLILDGEILNDRSLFRSLFHDEAPAKEPEEANSLQKLLMKKKNSFNDKTKVKRQKTLQKAMIKKKKSQSGNISEDPDYDKIDSEPPKVPNCVKFCLWMFAWFYRTPGYGTIYFLPASKSKAKRGPSKDACCCFSGKRNGMIKAEQHENEVITFRQSNGAEPDIVFEDKTYKVRWQRCPFESADEVENREGESGQWTIYKVDSSAGGTICIKRGSEKAKFENPIDRLSSTATFICLLCVELCALLIYSIFVIWVSSQWATIIFLAIQLLILCQRWVSGRSTPLRPIEPPKWLYLINVKQDIPVSQEPDSTWSGSTDAIKKEIKQQKQNLEGEMTKMIDDRHKVMREETMKLLKEIHMNVQPVKDKEAVKDKSYQSKVARGWQNAMGGAMKQHQAGKLQAFKTVPRSNAMKGKVDTVINCNEVVLRQKMDAAVGQLPLQTCRAWTSLNSVPFSGTDPSAPSHTFKILRCDPSTFPDDMSDDAKLRLLKILTSEPDCDIISICNKSHPAIVNTLLIPALRKFGFGASGPANTLLFKKSVFEAEGRHVTDVVGCTALKHTASQKRLLVCLETRTPFHDPQRDTVTIMQGSSSYLAIAMKAEGQLWKKTEYVQRVRDFLINGIHQGKMKVQDFANAMYALAILHRRSKYCPGEYVIAQRTFTAADNSEIPTQLWAGYARLKKKQLPQNEYILVDVGSGESKYFLVLLAPDGGKVKKLLSRQLKIDESKAVNRHLEAACLAHLEQFVEARTKIEGEEKKPVRNTTHDFTKLLADTLLNKQLITSAKSMQGTPMNQLPIRYICTESIRAMQVNKYSKVWDTMMSGLRKEMEDRSRDVTLDVLAREVEADCEFQAAQAGFMTAVIAEDLDTGKYEGADKKSQETILKGCFPQLPKGVYDRRKLHVISNLAWGRGSTQGVIDPQKNAPKEVFTTNFSMNLALQWTQDFLKDNTEVATIEEVKDANTGKVTEFIKFPVPANPGQRQHLQKRPTVHGWNAIDALEDDGSIVSKAQKCLDSFLKDEIDSIASLPGLLPFVLSRLTAQLDAQTKLESQKQTFAALEDESKGDGVGGAVFVGSLISGQPFDTVLPDAWSEGGVLKDEADPTTGFWHSRGSLGCLSSLQSATPADDNADADYMLCSKAAEFTFGPENTLQPAAGADNLQLAATTPVAATEASAVAQAAVHVPSVSTEDVIISTGDNGGGVSPGSAQYSPLKREENKYLARATNAQEQVAKGKAELAATAADSTSASPTGTTRPAPALPSSESESDESDDEGELL